MNPSIQRRLSLWLTAVILATGIGAALMSFVVAYHDATISQDAQLGQVAAALARGSYKDAAPETGAESGEGAEDRFFVIPLGTGRPNPRSTVDLDLPPTLTDGLQSVRQGGQEWRVKVVRDSFGERFGVAQSMKARNEDAQDGALFILIPIALLIPVLLVAVHVILRTLFSPLNVLSREMDRVDGATLNSLPIALVPLELIPFVEAVNRLVRRLASALDQQGRFVAYAAHELRSPVAALMVQAENVQKISLSVEAGERLSLLRRGLQRLAALQDQLLVFARVQVPLNQAAHVIELDAVVRTMIEDLLPMASAKGIDLGCTEIAPVRILGDLRHAGSLVRNALDNAIRYTPSGGSVDVSVSQEDRAVSFVVEDSGPGIRAADIPNVFEPFVRVLGTQETGSGLGLAIVRAAATAMGGTVELASRRDGRPGLRFVYRQTTA